MAEVALEFAPPSAGSVDVLFLAGEHSGDQHAAEIAREISRIQPDWKLAAVGGPSLEKAGAQLLHDLTRDSVVGLVEVLKHYGQFKAIFEALVAWVDTHRPKVIVMVDYPGFNLRFAEALRKRGISRKGGGSVAVYQYVSPQIWAWKAKRRFKMAEILDELGVIFPFELDCYKDTTLPVHFVGHPFARDDYRNPLAYDPDGPVLLLPGSRKQAVSRIFPLLIETAKDYLSNGGNRKCVCLYPDSEILSILEADMDRLGMDSSLIELKSVEEGAHVSAVLTSSGTMSLNCALAGIPGVIVYRAHPLTAWIGRRLVHIEWLGIANLVLGRTLYAEFIQGAAKPKLLAGKLKDLLASTDAREAFSAAARELEIELTDESGTTVVERLRALVQ